LDAENVNEICVSSEKDVISAVTRDTVASPSVTKVHGPVCYMRPKLHLRNFVDSMNTEDEKTTVCITCMCSGKQVLHKI
jgi:hypothetical protein